MKRLIPTIAALVVATSAQAAPINKSEFCGIVGRMGESIATARDTGKSQMDVTEFLLSTKSLPEVQRVTVGMADEIYNNPAFRYQPPAKIGAAYTLSCLRVINQKGAL